MATRGSAGGNALAKKMTPDERTEAAKRAAAARWSAPEPKKAIAGSPDRPIRIGDQEIECYVLEDGTRVLTQASMLAAMGRSRKLPSLKGSDPAMPPILQGKAIRQFIPEKMVATAMPIPFRLPNGVKASGYRAELLPELCNVYLAARAAEKLPSNQESIAKAAEVIVRGLAVVGITALVDEATGYQETRAKDALAKILEAYVAEDLQQWVSTFPVDYYKHICRLRGIEFDPDSVKRPPYFGHLTNDVVYKRIAPGVFEAIKEEQRKDAKKKRAKMHQQLTRDVGHPQLREHLSSVTTIMKLSDDWVDFKAKLDRVHPIVDTSLPPTLWDDEPDSGTGI